jgi:hypothetical protein
MFNPKNKTIQRTDLSVAAIVRMHAGVFLMRQFQFRENRAQIPRSLPAECQHPFKRPECLRGNLFIDDDLLPTAACECIMHGEQ